MSRKFLVEINVEEGDLSENEVWFVLDRLDFVGTIIVEELEL